VGFAKVQWISKMKKQSLRPLDGTTVVSLEDIRHGGSFDPKLFTLIDPPGATASRHDP